MKFDKWAGDLLGLPDGLHTIESGHAALIGFVFVALGWIISSRQQKEKYRVESARSTLMIENEKFQKHIPIIAPYFMERRSFPKYEEIYQGDENKPTRVAIQQVLTLLEITALDISTGRASERYVRSSQRSMICTISICAQTYVNSARVFRDEKRLYQCLEILFIRLYFNRYAVFQWTMELLWGQPIYKYSYLMFRLRYLIACVPFGFDGNYRNEPWPRIKEQMRKMRRMMEAVWPLVRMPWSRDCSLSFSKQDRRLVMPCGSGPTFGCSRRGGTTSIAPPNDCWPPQDGIHRTRSTIRPVENS